MLELPSDDEILAFAATQQIGRAPIILRDLARMATILHLDDEGFFGEDTVLAGGTAVRCYGGHRFTVTDVDTSTNAKVKLGELDKKLNWELEDRLSVWTDGVGYFEPGADLEKAKPIHFDPLFSEIQMTEAQAQFELTVSFRGLELDPLLLPLRHDYPWKLGIEDRPIPIMDFREVLAEKVLGYGVMLVAKHYADVAFLAYAFRDELANERQVLKRLVSKKLEIGRDAADRGGEGYAKDRYAEVPDIEALRERLEEPERFLGVTEFGSEVRFVLSAEGRNAISLQTAKKIVRAYVVPWLFE